MWYVVISPTYIWTLSLEKLALPNCIHRRDRRKYFGFPWLAIIFICLWEGSLSFIELDLDMHLLLTRFASVWPPISYLWEWRRLLDPCSLQTNLNGRVSFVLLRQGYFLRMIWVYQESRAAAVLLCQKLTIRRDEVFFTRLEQLPCSQYRHAQCTEWECEGNMITMIKHQR